MYFCLKKARYSMSSRTNDTYSLWVLVFSKITCPSLSSDIPAGKEAVHGLSSAEVTSASMAGTEWDT